jgi:hypothetical protein
MRLVAEHDDNRVIVIDDLEQLLEVGSQMIRVENVPRVLGAIRSAAKTLLPATPVDPARMEHLAARLQGLAQTAAALAAKAPADDPDALAITAALTELGLTPARR